MSEFLHKLFSSDFMGHGYCYLWKPEIVWLHAISDSGIALSYYVIPPALFYFVRNDLITLSDHTVTFVTKLGPIDVKAKFSTHEMVYQGKLEL